MADPDYEKLGAFYLGRPYDAEADALGPQPFLYDSKDLTTHAVILGMTGSGKTGLAVTLLEEAAIDGIPIIAIDPKGDLPNLMLTFPQLRAEDFRPWISEADAARKGRSADEHAKAMADLWRSGLGEWDQKPTRIGRFAKASERVIYTPGSRAGVPVSALGSFAPPEAGTDEDAKRERVMSAASGLLGLLGIDADPIRSREHILLSNLFQRAWDQGQALDLPTLIRQIQDPPIERVGVLDLDSFFPQKDRFALAMTLNNLLASPGFEAWTEGQPLDMQKILYGPKGPRLSIFSIAHLSDPERMFFVTLLLNELVSWMRAQPGSTGLRALLYMDEVFGYLPPTANPPSKLPMLTLLKQARAYGVGTVLATQNPVDLDYKALSNMGTWFLGRLQTERDKARLIDGLESAATSAAFDRAQLERTLSNLESRTFLMNNVHEDAPTLFKTRWALSYLAGPITREQIKTLEDGKVLASNAPAEPSVSTSKKAAKRVERAAAAAPAAEDDDASARPVLPSGVAEAFLPLTRIPGPGESLVYRPCLGASVSLHYANASAKVDRWDQVAMLAALDDDDPNPWDAGREIGAALPDLDDAPHEGARFAALPSAAARAKTHTKWRKMLAAHVYRERALTIWKSKKPKLVGQIGESEDAFRGRVRDAVREQRDLAIEKLRKKFAPKLARLQDRIETAQMRVEKEQEQYEEKKRASIVSIGTTVIGALFGRKMGSVSRAGTTLGRMSRTAREKSDIGRAEAKVEQLQEQLDELDAQCRDEVAELEEAIDTSELPIDSVRVAPRKSDIDVEQMLVLWTPWRIDAQGVAEPAFEALEPS